MNKKPSEFPKAPPMEIRGAILQDLYKMSYEQQQRMAQFGRVKPEIAIKYSGYQFVAVGKRLFYAKEWKSFADFLIGYVPEVFDKKWWAAEIAKPQAEWNQVCEWREAMRQYAKAQKPLPDGTYSVGHKGFAAAYLAFAYDMYVVEHNGTLDETLVERLKNKEQFQGARHELFAEATCLRAGFTVEHENEKDRTRKHSEFVATHEQSGLKFSVEAKSKHRAGVLGRPGIPQSHEKISLNFGQLINSALAKNPPHPLAVFVDTNLPPRGAQRLYAPRIENGREIPSRLLMGLLDRVAKEHDGNDPYAMLIFSNHPHHYASPDELDPQRNLLAVSARNPAATQLPALHAFYTAARLYGNIPNELPAGGANKIL
jgi:hypothetical protein